MVLKDDATILDGDGLWRRIRADWVVHDENRGGLRVSSAAFADSRDGSPTSVLLESAVRETGRSEVDVLREFPGYALASVTAGDARECQQKVVRDPKGNEAAHALLFGRKTKANRRCLAAKAEWVVPPAGG